jgi:hypothetical protein
MTRRHARAVVVADVRRRVVALRAVDNGSGFGFADVGRLVLSAGVTPRAAGSGYLIGLSELPDVEALAEYRGVVVQRTGDNTRPSHLEMTT